MSGEEPKRNETSATTTDEPPPATVDALLASIRSFAAEVVVLHCVEDGRQRPTFATDVSPVPDGARSDDTPAVDVSCVTAEPPVARPIPLEAIESVRPIPDRAAVTAALPPDTHARATILRGLADHAPALVDVAVVLSVLDRDPSAHPAALVAALDCLARLARDRPDDCLAAVPRVGTLVSRTTGAETGTETIGADTTGRDEIRTGALAAFAALAATCPEHVTPHVSSVFPALDAPGPVDASAAVACVAHVAGDDPTAVVDCADDLAGFLDGDDADGRKHATYAIGRIAAVDPGAVRPMVGRLVSVVDDPTAPQVTRLNATCAVGRVAREWPDAVVDHVPTFVAVLDADTAGVGIRANAAGVVGDVAVTHVVDVRRHVDALVAAVDDEDGVVRANATTAVARVAREFPDALVDAVDRLVGCLDDEESLVRENACWTLGYLREDARVARSELDRLRVDDASQRVRDRACWAVDEVTGGDGERAGD
ncbi:HEAT repeat domain-containing protein [Salinigranum salinum]|uniref:HEAT repeat domain-containing protein n=1 Tax=Salinigranum salinum TaxID=1364937 RepID=UPI001863A330|nr:HEAT repeat domain-containing protein [Salinigranum salinum]